VQEKFIEERRKASEEEKKKREDMIIRQVKDQLPRNH
jgi:hypothetical protein